MNIKNQMVFLLKLEEFIWQFRRLLIVFIAAIIIQIFELTLLYYKYDIFTGGFLQPYSYRTLPERLTFIFFALWFDLTLYGFVASLWFLVADKLNKYGLIIYYNFTVMVVLSVGIWLALKFKVLSYFSDTINLQIIKNLGGGSLKEALLYASNEIGLFIAILGIITLFLVCFIKLLDNKFVYQFSKINIKHTSYVRLLFLTIVITPLLALFISGNDFLRYGLEKKTSYRLISSGLDKLSDIDSDGFGIFSYPKDNAVFNADIYPGALDIPGNGIDEDGFLGDAALTPLKKDSFSEIPHQSGKHIVLIVLESARADLLDQKINDGYVAPVMRDIASSGSSIKNAYSHTGYTTTSITAIFNRELVKNNDKLTLIQFLQSAGYQLSIISGQDESFGNVAYEVGMKNDGVYYFDARTAINDRVFPSTEQGSLRLSEERVIEQFQAQVKQLDFTKPQFIYLNFQAAHFPYSHPKIKKRIIDDLIPRSKINLENKKWVSDTYWNAIANADWAVGKVIESLKDRKLLNQVTIVILGDHGESLFDDGFLGHGHAINDSQTKIPLIINNPDVIADAPIGQVDIAEITIRSALGLTNHLANKDKIVFQLVGSLSQPTLIAHVKQDGVRTLFDFRSEQVFFSELKLWKPYEEALLEPVYKDRIVNLIREWETLRWRQYVAEKQ
ncbi:MAG: sulfatase-like hydrolase/transferase [Methylobacter sp.]